MLDPGLCQILDCHTPAQNQAGVRNDNYRNDNFLFISQIAACATTTFVV